MSRAARRIAPAATNRRPLCALLGLALVLLYSTSSAGSQAWASEQAVAATTYYVSPSGSDSNPGTSSAPWRTVQKALTSMAAGGVTIVRAGTYAEDLVYDRGLSSWTTLQGEPGAVLDGVSTHTLRVNSAGRFLRVRGFKILGAPIGSGGCIDLYGQDLEILESEITGCGDQGIYTDEGSRRILIARNLIHGVGGHRTASGQSNGIYLQGYDHRVESNLVRDNRYGFGIQVYDFDVNPVIINNTVVNSAHGGITVGGTSGAVIVGNVLYDNDTEGINRSSVSSSSCSIHDNLAFANGTNYDSGWPSGCFGSDNAVADPLFVDYAGRNLRLRDGSPGIDTSDPAFSPLALDGAARPQGAGPDKGAYERASGASAPVNTSLPTISGTATAGQTLTASNGTWTNSPTSYAHQWRRCDSAGSNCVNIGGATGQSYLLGSADVGTTMRVVVTASNAGGSSSATSAQTAVVGGVPPTNTSRPQLSGIAKDGQTLTTSTGTWSGTTPIAYAFGWRRCDTNGNNCTTISGATGQSYVLTTADVGSKVDSLATATNAAGSASMRSYLSATVVAAAPVNTVRPALSGTARDGETLTTSTGTWSGTTPIAYTYQWRRCDSAGANCVDIAGATGQSYTLTSADVGSKVYAGVTATNGAGSAWMRTYLSATVVAAP